jgi:hypothetical protein
MNKSNFNNNGNNNINNDVDNNIKFFGNKNMNNKDKIIDNDKNNVKILNNWEKILEKYVLNPFFDSNTKTEKLNKIYNNLDNNNNNDKKKQYNLVDTDFPKCEKINETNIEYFSNSIEINNINTIIPISCLVSFIHIASTSNHVLTISINPLPTLLNFEARGLIQSSNMNIKPYSNLGLTGKNQICGVADSGLNDMSCFFIDDNSSKEYKTKYTNRNGVVEKNRRKNIQYVSFADSVDEEG